MLDINSEEYREYVFSDSIYRIDNPVSVDVTDSGSHRVVDSDGVTHRPATNWIALRWKPKSGEPSYVA